MTLQKNSLSVVVLTHNDELRIVDCLEQVKFADELIVIDDNSTDRTIELVEKFTKNIYTHSLNSNFSSQRNFALNKVHSDWVLFVDSDEYVSEKLKREIVNIIKTDRLNGFYLDRVDFMWGQKIKYGEVGNTKLLRLARKDSGKWHGKVHEEWLIKGEIGYLKSPLVHVPHQNVKDFLADINEYSTIRALELFENGVKESPIKIPMYPLAKFFVNYFVKKGYMDGIPGFIYASMMSFHSFLVRAKLFQLNNQGN